MVTCSRAIDLLFGVLEGDVSEQVRREVTGHFAGCPSCHHFLESYRRTCLWCRQSLRRQLPAHLGDRLMAYLRDHSGPRRPAA